MAAGLLDTRGSWLDVDRVTLCVDAQRLRLRQRLLGLSAVCARVALCARLVFRGISPISGICLQSAVSNRSVASLQQPFRGACVPVLFLGDYYGSQYAGLGIYPWFSIGTGGYVYDPIFAYRNWFYGRENPKWRDGFRQRYDRLAKDGSARPPHTFRDQQALAQRGLSTNASNRVMVMPVREALNGNRSGNYIIQVNDAQRREAQQFASEHHNLAQQRNKFEKSGGGKQQPATGTRSNAHPKFRLPRASSAPRSQTRTPGEAGATRPPAEKKNRNPGQATPARPESNRSGEGRQIRLKPVQPGVVPQKQSAAPPTQQRSLTPPPSPRPERGATNKAIPPRKPPVRKTEKEK